MRIIDRLDWRGIIVVASVHSFASGAGEAASLEDYGISPLPCGQELQQDVYPDSLVTAVPLSPDDISQDFSNTEDLAWLVDAAASSRCVMLGESHYGRTVYALENRLVFALNSARSYPLVVLEMQYSLTPFMNHYLDMEDDLEAAAYLDDVGPMITCFVEDVERLVHIRRWNLTHPGREIHLGCSDIEHDYRATLGEILLPYLTQADPTIDIDPDSTFHLEILDRMPELRAAADAAREAGVRSGYPFITADYIDRVLDNLESTCHAYSEDRMNLNHMRQQAIVRNLTDERFLGGWTRNGGFIVVCGGWHARSGTEYPFGGDFLSEGSYLQHDFAPTAGKVFSLYMDNYSYSLDSMDGVDLARCGMLGSGYRRTIQTLQEVCTGGLASPSDRLVIYREIGALDRLLLAAAEQFQGSPALLTEIDTEGIAEFARTSGSAGYMRARTGLLRTCECYDALVVLPGSPVVRAAVEE